MPTALLMDIEGTTTAIAFVYDVLFPFAREALPGFLVARWGTPEVAEAVSSMSPDALTPEAAWRVAEGLMDADVKDTGLKALQGMVWAAGFADGRLKSHLFPDVAPVLRALHAAGVTLAIYSSGSVSAQQLLFGHAEDGDLRPMLSGYFDTTTGPKREAASYSAIAAALGRPPEELLFASDHPAELAAARAAGCPVVALVRPGNAPLPDEHGFEVLSDFEPLRGRFGVA